MMTRRQRNIHAAGKSTRSTKLKNHGYQNQSEETRRQKTRPQEKGRRQEEVTGLSFGSPPGRFKPEWRTAIRTRTRWICRWQSGGFFI